MSNAKLRSYSVHEKHGLIWIGMDNKTSPHIDLPIDGGRLRFRRQLLAMINEEKQVDAQMQG